MFARIPLLPHSYASDHSPHPILFNSTTSLCAYSTLFNCTRLCSFRSFVRSHWKQFQLSQFLWQNTSNVSFLLYICDDIIFCFAFDLYWRRAHHAKKKIIGIRNGTKRKVADKQFFFLLASFTISSDISLPFTEFLLNSDSKRAILCDT